MFLAHKSDKKLRSNKFFCIFFCYQQFSIPKVHILTSWNVSPKPKNNGIIMRKMFFLIIFTTLLYPKLSLLTTTFFFWMFLAHKSAKKLSNCLLFLFFTINNLTKNTTNLQIKLKMPLVQTIKLTMNWRTQCTHVVRCYGTRILLSICKNHR